MVTVVKRVTADSTVFDLRLGRDARAAEFRTCSVCRRSGMAVSSAGPSRWVSATAQLSALAAVRSLPVVRFRVSSGVRRRYSKSRSFYVLGKWKTIFPSAVELPPRFRRPRHGGRPVFVETHGSQDANTTPKLVLTPPSCRRFLNLCEYPTDSVDLFIYFVYGCRRVGASVRYCGDGHRNLRSRIGFRRLLYWGKPMFGCSFYWSIRLLMLFLWSYYLCCPSSVSSITRGSYDRFWRCSHVSLHLDVMDILLSTLCCPPSSCSTKLQMGSLALTPCV